MSERPGPILVAGARGNQGGATLRHLLAQGWKVRAMTRQLDSEKSHSLRDLGAELVRGDYDDRTSLDHALEGVYGVFMPSFQASARNLLETETRYGTTFLLAVKNANVKHLVYASETGQGANADLRYLQSKRRVEVLIHDLGLQATILRHAFFLDWLVGPAASMIWSGLRVDPEKDRAFQVICLDDAAAFAAHAFDNPMQFIGKNVEIAGDEITLEQLSQTYQRIMGKAPKSSKLPIWLLTRMGDFGKFAVNIPALTSRADIASLRASYPKLRKLEEAMRAAIPMQYPPR